MYTYILLEYHINFVFVSRTIPAASLSNEVFSEHEWDEFLSMKSKVIADITSVQPFDKLPFLTSKVETMLSYNLTSGTIAGGLNTIYVYKMICKPKDQTSENIDLAILMGWCFRFVSIKIIFLFYFGSIIPIWLLMK